MAKVVKCRVQNETEAAVRILIPVPNHPDRQRSLYVPLSQCDKIVRAGALVRKDNIYCDTVTVSDWLAQKEDL